MKQAKNTLYKAKQNSNREVFTSVTGSRLMPQSIPSSTVIAEGIS